MELQDITEVNHLCESIGLRKEELNCLIQQRGRSIKDGASYTFGSAVGYISMKIPKSLVVDFLNKKIKQKEHSICLLEQRLNKL